MQNERREIMTLLPKPLIKKSNRIAAYCRVSSQQDEQLHRLAAQVTYYENLLSRSDDCEFAGISQKAYHVLGATRSTHSCLPENCAASESMCFLRRRTCIPVRRRESCF